MTRDEKRVLRLLIDTVMKLLTCADMGDFETDELHRALFEARKILEPKRRKRK